VIVISMPRLFACLLAVLGSSAVAAAQSLLTTLIAPGPVATAGAEVTVELAVFNAGDVAVNYEPPSELAATVTGSDGAWPAVLQLRRRAASAVPAGGFVRHGYALALPQAAVGVIVLEVADQAPGVLRTALRTELDPAALPSVLNPKPVEPVSRPADQISAQRTFARRFSAHEPIYFIYGPDAPGAKFQFSFKYRLLAFDRKEGQDGALTAQRLQFGYTQRSLWDIDAESSPFYDSSYMPSLFYELLATPERSDGGLNWLGFQGGFQHESNGRDGQDSRSLNTLFLRTGIVAGRMDSWHLTASVRGYAFVTDLSDNAAIEDYRGYAEWLVTIGRGEGAQLALLGRAGRDFKRFTTQLDLSVPVRIRLFDFATYFLLQYFNGYGESLRTYETKSETIRGGFSFVR